MIHFKRALILLVFTLQHFTASAECQKCESPPDIYCENLVNISLDHNGEALLMEDMLLEDGTHDDCTSTEDLIYMIMVPATNRVEPPSGQ